MKKIITFFVVLMSIVSNAQLTDVVSSLNDPTSIAIYGDDIYIAGLRTVSKINLLDANPTPVDILTDISNGAHLLVDGNDLYIGLFAGGKVIKIDLSSNDTTPVDVVTDVYGTNGLIIKDNFLYIAESTQDKISRVDLSQSNPTAVDFLTDLDFPNGLFINEDDLYFIQTGANKISKVDLTQVNPTPVDVITDLDGVSLGLIIIEDELYFSYYGEDKIAKININDANPWITDVVTNVNGPAQLLYEDSELFVVVRFDNKIAKIDNATLSIQKTRSNSQISLYPNPSPNTISVLGLQEPLIGTLYATTGSKMAEVLVQQNSIIDLKNLQAGIYYLVFENGWTRKIIKK